MKADLALREIVRLMRCVNDYAERFDETAATKRADPMRQLALQGAQYQFSLEPLDAEAAVRELSGDAPLSVELRYALARWIAGRIVLKAGRKARGVPRRPIVPPCRAPLAARALTEDLLDWGSRTAPHEVSRVSRDAAIDLLVGARELKRGPGAASVQTLLTYCAAHNARLYHATLHVSMTSAIKRAAAEFGVKVGTVQRAIYQRKV